jgi:hypothetical protein
VANTDDHFVYALDARRGPRPDVDEFRPLVAEASRLVRLSQLAADAGYDSEGNHEFARDEHGIRTIIPAKHGRPTDKLPSGRYRRLMKVRFDRAAYRRRSQVETVVSMIKRRQGAHVHARSYHGQCRELRLIVLTHNIMILVILEVFYTADLTRIPCRVRWRWVDQLTRIDLGPEILSLLICDPGDCKRGRLHRGQLQVIFETGSSALSQLDFGISRRALVPGWSGKNRGLAPCG